MDRSKRRQRFICSWTTLIAPTPRKRQNPEDINRLPFLITRRQDNGLAPFNSAAALLFSPHTRPGRYGFLLPKRERGEKRNSIFPVRPLAMQFTHMPSFGAPWMQRSELGRKIPVDLEADAHFDECRSCP